MSMDYLTIYFLMMILWAIVRLLSMYPDNPDRTVITHALVWPLVLLIYVLRFNTKLLLWLFTDIHKLIRDK
jgi:hypothetical protein